MLTAGRPAVRMGVAAIGDISDVVIWTDSVTVVLDAVANVRDSGTRWETSFTLKEPGTDALAALKQRSSPASHTSCACVTFRVVFCRLGAPLVFRILDFAEKR